MIKSARYVSALAAVQLAACSAQPASNSEEARVLAGPASPDASSAPAAAQAKPHERLVLALGDSLYAGYGVDQSQSLPTVLERELAARGIRARVVNAGVSGDTSAGGLERLEWALQGDVRVLIVALGANDGLRGLPPDQLQRNLSEVIERAQARGITVILAGMEAPPNYGRDYIVSFHNVYPALAQRYRVAFVPFLLQGVAGTPSLNQSDGIHPTAAGARIVADNVWAVLRPIVDAQRDTTHGRRPGS